MSRSVPATITLLSEIRGVGGRIVRMGDMSVLLGVVPGLTVAVVAAGVLVVVRRRLRRRATLRRHVPRPFKTSVTRLPGSFDRNLGRAPIRPELDVYDEVRSSQRL